MQFTLIFIYVVGFGNQAVNTEKFMNLKQCEAALEIVKTQLSKDFKFGQCTG